MGTMCPKRELGRPPGIVSELVGVRSALNEEKRGRGSGGPGLMRAPFRA